MEGWIKLHRQFTKWEWYDDSCMVHLFLHLLLKANHAPKKWRGIQVERGQLITGRKILSAETGISEKMIRARLIKLEKGQEIVIKRASKFSIITICKYDKYQSKEKEEGQQRASKRAAKGPAEGHKQEGRRIKEEKKETKLTRKPEVHHQGLADFLQ